MHANCRSSTHTNLPPLSGQNSFLHLLPLRWKVRAENAPELALTIKWRCVHCHCHDFRFYVTLFPKCFSNFRSRYLFDIGLPNLYLTLADTYLPLDTAFPSSATRFDLCNEVQEGLAEWADTFFGSILT